MIDLSAPQTRPTEHLPSELRPTESDVTRATARRLGELHAAGGHEPAGHCWWCLKPWPCPDKVWSDRVLRAAYWGAPE